MAIIYLLYFVTGATALVFEILWTRQFSIVFGSSTYAMSVVLAAFMGGLGIGGWLFGRIVDRRGDPLRLFALIEAGVIVWALLIPAFLRLLGSAMPAIAAAMPNLAAESAVRFAFSFAILLVPCVLMGGTLPVLTRFVAPSSLAVAKPLSALYGLNTLGSAVGCFAAGFWLMETIGQSGTNLVAVGANVAVLAAVVALRAFLRREGAGAEREPLDDRAPAGDTGASSGAPRGLLLFVAFVSGFACMAVEVLWVRYLVFAVPNNEYSFTSILGVLLVGLALGSLLYNALIARRERQLAWLAVVELVIGPAILAMLVASAWTAMGKGPGGFAGGDIGQGLFNLKVGAVSLAAVTMLIPAVLMGIVFPLVASAYAESTSGLGRRVGGIYAVSTLGSIAGSLAPVVFLVGWLGIQNGIFAIAILTSAVGVGLAAAAARERKAACAGAAFVAAAVIFVAAARFIPSSLTKEIFFSSPKHEGHHQQVLFYREGPAATVMVVRNTLTGFKEVYIGGIEEVPTAYTGHVFFKLFGALAPLLHDDPRDVLVLCLGGGVSAGTAIENPQVQRVECVDLVRDMLGACRALGDVNNNLVASPKFSAEIEDARNYLAKTRGKFPVIICDSTHPKSPDSWPLYTQEFYRDVKGALAPDGIFVQWAPCHSLGIREYQIILKTFQSQFPHTSIWYVAGFDETGDQWETTMMLATPERLSIDPARLALRLSAESMRKDLKYWSFDTPEGLLGTFLCGEESVRRWTDAAPVNTDDLPLTQYYTRFTNATEYGMPELAGRLESVAPYLKADTSADGWQALKAALDRGLAARKAFLRQNVAAALKIDPTNGTLLTIRDNLRRGEEYLKSLAALYRNDEAMLVRIGHRLQAACQHQGKEPGECFGEIDDIYRRALDLRPQSVPALAGHGALLSASGAVVDGLKCLQNASAMDPGNFDAAFGLGIAYSQADKFPEAADAFARAAEISPQRVDVQNQLAIALTAIGDAGKAIPHLQKAIELSAGSIPDFYYNLGCAYAAKGDKDNAIDSFRRAIADDTSQPSFHAALGSMLADKGDVVSARPELEKALSLDPENPECLAKLGAILLGENRVDDAIADLRKALAANTADPETRENLGRAYALKRDFPNAIGILREGMRLQPTPGIARALAWLLATCPAPHLRDGREAVSVAENLDKATGSISAQAADTLAAAYAEAGRFDDAVKAAEQALTRAKLHHDDDLAPQIEKRLELYKASRPYHEE